MAALIRAGADVHAIDQAGDTALHAGRPWTGEVVATVPKARKATKPTFGSKQRRLAGKATRAQVKQLRGRVSGSD